MLSLSWVINQKYFYGFDEDKKKAVIFKVRQIEITKELKKYLKEKKISIKYFKNFEGFIFLYIFDSFSEYRNNSKKGVYIYFVTFLNKKKIFINDSNDLDMLLIMFKNYLYVYDYYIISEKFDLNKNLYIDIYKLLVNNKRYNFIIDFNLIDFINCFEKYKNLINNNIKYKSVKLEDYVFIETRSHFNIKQLYNYFCYYNMETFYEEVVENFLYFMGFCCLIEVEVVCNNKKLKRFIIFFYNLHTKVIKYYLLLNRIFLNFLLYVLKNILIESDVDMSNEEVLEVFENQVKDLDFSIKKLDLNIIVNKENMKIMKIKDFENLIFYLEYYNSFLKKELI